MKKTSILVMNILGVCCAVLNIYAQDITDSAETEAVEKKIQSVIKNADDDQVLRILIGRLDSEDALEYLNERDEAGNHDLDIDIMKIFQLIAVFGMPVFIVGLICYFSYRENKSRYQIVNNMVDKGMEIPAHILEKPKEKRTPRSDLRNGLILISIGLGLACFLGIHKSSSVSSLGLIPLFVGIAYLIIWKLESGKHKEKAIEE